MPDQPVTLQDLANDIPITENPTPRIESTGLVGGGVMGRGLAQTLAAHGLTVVIVEKDEARSSLCLEGISENMDREIERWAMTSGEKKAILSRIKVTTDLEEIAHTDLVMEVVDENFALKHDLLHREPTKIKVDGR